MLTPRDPDDTRSTPILLLRNAGETAPAVRCRRFALTNFRFAAAFFAFRASHT
jgi:hypothetical protein